MRIAHFYEADGHTVLAVNAMSPLPVDDPGLNESLAKHGITIGPHSLEKGSHELNTVASMFFELRPALDADTVKPVSIAVLKAMTNENAVDGVVLDCMDGFMPHGQPPEAFEAHVVASNLVLHHPAPRAVA